MDGVLQTSENLGGRARTVNTGSSAAYIGRSVGATAVYYDGDIDDVRLYDNPLSAEQVQRLFGGGRSSSRSSRALIKTDLDDSTGLRASSESALTEDNLDGAVVTLTLTGDEFAATVAASQVSVAGIDGVGVASVTRDSGTQLSVTLAFDGTDFDVDGELAFTVAAAAITGSTTDLSTAGLAVTAVVEAAPAAGGVGGSGADRGQP